MKVYKVREIGKTASTNWHLYATYNVDEAIAEARVNDDNPNGAYEAEHYKLWTREKKSKVSEKIEKHLNSEHS